MVGSELHAPSNIAASKTTDRSWDRMITLDNRKSRAQAMVVRVIGLRKS
jgi:hypothetical protein